MTFLVDFQIAELCRHQKLVDPFDPDLINPASLDCRLGHMIQLEAVGTSDMIEIDISEATQDEPFWLPPGGFMLAHTVETWCLNERLTAQFVLKSSRAREGIDHLNAGWCDPGWGWGGDEKRSSLTMEIKNARQLWPVAFWPGMKIGQMKFSTTDELPLKSYAVTGRYNGDKIVHGSKG